jgi:hypothetical protein
MDTHPSAVHERRLTRSLLAIALAGLLVAALAPVALATQPEVPGNNGTVKIHDGAGEPASETRNEPHVCTFHLHFFFADAGDSGTWEIQVWSPGDKGALGQLSGGTNPGTYTTNSDGEVRVPASGTYSLPDGHYKLFWDGDLDTDKHDKHKVFWVECGDQGGGQAPATPTPTPTSPGGGGGEGGGGVGPTQGTNPTPTPVSGGVGPTQGTNATPTPANGGVAPTENTAPEGGVAAATATPGTTLPPTDTASATSSGSTGLWAALLLLLAVVTTATLATVPAYVRRDRRQ